MTARSSRTRSQVGAKPYALLMRALKTKQVTAVAKIALRNIEIYVLKGVGHQFGPRQAEGLEKTATWLLGTLSR